MYPSLSLPTLSPKPIETVQQNEALVKGQVFARKPSPGVMAVSTSMSCLMGVERPDSWEGLG